MKKTIFFIVALVVILVVLSFIKTSSKKTSPVGKGSIQSMSIERPNIRVAGNKLTKVEVWAVPTGIGITEEQYQKLGEAALTETKTDDSQVWTLAIPKDPVLATEIFAKGFVKTDLVGTVKLSVTGASEIYNMLWGTPAGEVGLRWLDGGHTFVFNPAERFTVILDSKRYPQNKLICKPEGIIGGISNAPSPIASNSYAASFETVKAGICKLASGDFSTTINVLDDISKPRTITDNAHGFSVTYSGRAYRTATESSVARLGTPTVRIGAARNGFENTNLSEALVSFGSSKDSKIVAVCTEPQAGDGETKGEDRTIGGIAFRSFSRSGAAAGTLSETQSYRVVQKGVCYWINRDVRYGNIGNYTPGDVRVFDSKAVTDLLDAVIVGFKFL